MLIELANHNPDIRRLMEKGYALRVDGAHLVVLDIPYLDSAKALQVGAFVAKLEFIDKIRVKQDNHQVYFAGSAPHGLDGNPIPNLGGGSTTIALTRDDVVVQRSFSNKPPAGFPDFFEKIEHYVRVVSGPAMALHAATPLTFRVDKDVHKDSVFKLHDTLTSRAEISDLATVFKNEVVAVIGLGGTGSYLLDYLIKTPVREIRAFDGDAYHVHNAFRSPGKLDEQELGLSKAEVYDSRYQNFREGLVVRKAYIDSSMAHEFDGVTFAFVCVDKGTARAETFDLLIRLKIPFIDAGMVLNRKQGKLAGTLRVTYCEPENASQIRSRQLVPLTDELDDGYRQNVQIAELNALNAAVAIIRYKQLKGFYLDDSSMYHLLMGVDTLRTFLEPST